MQNNSGSVLDKSNQTWPICTEKDNGFRFNHKINYR